MAINYPSTLDTITQFPQPAGTSALTSPDHAALHTNTSILGTVIENLLGTTLGTNILNPGIKNASDQLFALNSGGTANQTIVKGTANNMTMGSQAATGGTLSAVTLSGQGTWNGTVANTSLINGGTYGTVVLNVFNGWANANETGTMLGTLSANGIITGTLQVAATASNKYDKGDKLNFTQGGTNMYAYVYSIPTGTTLLITGGTDYAPGTTAITNLQYSKAQSPNGFPGTFNYTANETWTGTAPTTNTKRVSQFSMQGNMVYVRFYTSYSTGGSSTQMTINQPIPSLESSSIFHDFMYGALGTADNTAFAGISAGAVVMFSNTVIQNGPYGAQANKTAYISGFYAV